MVTNSCREAMAHPLASKTNVAWEMALRFGEQAVQRRSYPADLPFDFERTQPCGHETGETGDHVGGSKLNAAADDDELDIAARDRGESVRGRKACVADTHEVRKRADAECAFSLLQP
jgi:hypothetical protein